MYICYKANFEVFIYFYQKEEYCAPPVVKMLNA